MDVELLDPAPRAANIKRLADGGADFCITSVAHYLTARAQYGPLPARFAAVIGQRHTIGAIVAEDHPASSPEGLAGCRLGGTPGNPLVESLLSALTWLGVAAPEVVPVDDPPAASLGGAEIDAMAATVDTLRRNARLAPVPVRAVSVGADAYMSGLVAADRVPDEVVRRVADALIAALHTYRLDPASGVSALCSRYTDVDPQDALDGWTAVADYIFVPDRPVGSMTLQGWEQALRFTSSAHGLPLPEPETVYRPQFLLASA